MTLRMPSFSFMRDSHLEFPYRTKEDVDVDRCDDHFPVAFANLAVDSSPRSLTD
jgi:hypothetical protein